MLISQQVVIETVVLCLWKGKGKSLLEPCDQSVMDKQSAV